MNLDAYLRRIGLDHRPPPTLAGLRTVHRAHLFAIPYENIDVQLGRPLTIERPPIFEKIVASGRGGWCYEMNGILGWALGELGFDITRATGAVFREMKGEPSVGNHLVLRVALPEGLFLADVGFGNGPHDPIPVA
ncbi:MAG: arylamine N-acetyltransferase, partial [Alphaproteobacteria bacterium]|nr:arylamine N-acetyltransferase [Alphaproteobacteria bacterium]